MTLDASGLPRVCKYCTLLYTHTLRLGVSNDITSYGYTQRGGTTNGLSLAFFVLRFLRHRSDQILRHFWKDDMFDSQLRDQIDGNPKCMATSEQSQKANIG